MSRRAALEADFAVASDSLTGVVDCLELGEDSVSFSVGDADFTILIVDAYPAGKCQVYGGEEEWELSGDVLQVIRQIIGLHNRENAAVGAGQISDGSDSEQIMEDDHDEELHVSQCSSRPLAESPLRRDVAEARRVFGSEAVDMSDMGANCRLLLYVDASADGAVTGLTASAWGIDVTQSLTIRIVLDPGEYRQPSRWQLQVFQGGSRETSKFEPEKQVTMILEEFFRAQEDFEVHDANAGISDVGQRPGSAKRQCMPPDRADIVERARQKKVALQFQALREERGKISQIMRYMLLRLPTLHEYCAMCDEPHTAPPMIQRTVCGRELCTWRFSQFGRLISDAESVNISAEVVDLLTCMAIHACRSSRRDLIFDPFPTLFLDGASAPALSADTPDRIAMLQKVMDDLEAVRLESKHSGASWVARSDLMRQRSELVRPMLQWITQSNRSVVVPLREEQRIPSLGTEWQYLLVCATPERESVFQKLKQKHGAAFAFHGSTIENWHSILRNGLKNASHTRLMTSGAAHGKGIYLSPKSAVSARYTRIACQGAGQVSATDKPIASKSATEEAGNRRIPLANLQMLAICEVVHDDSLRVHGDIWVASQEENVVARFFLVYTKAVVPQVDLQDLGIRDSLRKCVEALCQPTDELAIEAGRGGASAAAVDHP